MHNFETGGVPDEKKIAFNAEHVDADNGILRRIICECVREKGVKVLICAEQVSFMAPARR